MPDKPTPPRGKIAYLSLAADLRHDIASGRFAPDQRLPTEHELGQQYAVGRQTVRRALQELVAEGLLFRVRGRGTFAMRMGGDHHYLQSVASIDDLFAVSLDTTLETIEPLTRRIDVEAASRLQLPTDDVVAGVFRRIHDGSPFCVMKVHMTPDVGRRVMRREALPALHETKPDTVISVVDEVCRHSLMAAQQSITAGRAPAEIGATIGLGPDDWGLRIDRLYFDARSQPILLGVSYYHPDRYTYRLALRRTTGSSSGVG